MRIRISQNTFGSISRKLWVVERSGQVQRDRIAILHLYDYLNINFYDILPLLWLKVGFQAIDVLARWESAKTRLGPYLENYES